MGPAGDAAVERFGLAFGPDELVRLPCVRVRVGAVVTRMLAQQAAQVSDLAAGLGRLTGPVAVLAVTPTTLVRPIEIDPRQFVSHGGS